MMKESTDELLEHQVRLEQAIWKLLSEVKLLKEEAAEKDHLISYYETKEHEDTSVSWVCRLIFILLFWTSIYICTGLYI